MGTRPPCPASTPLEITPPEEAELPIITDAWIEITLVDDTGRIIPWEPYEVHLGTGRILKGELDEVGFARLEGLPNSIVKVVFPSRENTWWRPDTPPPPPALESEEAPIKAELPAACPPPKPTGSRPSARSPVISTCRWYSAATSTAAILGDRESPGDFRIAQLYAKAQKWCQRPI
ncbi:MAG: hypothetical protein HYX27_16805 [Acidobacteria bacterium]|nr:hypothetical protein [Acidobacteriota bacterium]